MWLFKPKNNEEYSDNELIALYKKNKDKKYVGELFKRYSHMVYGVCLKYYKNEEQSKDAVLEIFENLMEDLLKHNVANFKSWLHSVSRNHCLMYLRKQQTINKKVNEYEEAMKIEAAHITPYEIEDYEEKETLLTGLEKALKMLKEEQKICVELFFLHEKCYTEIADLTGYSLKQVKSYIQNGKRNLKNQLINFRTDET
jgi:RNA polymerase sigma-70 factor (ECF subfamily)